MKCRFSLIAILALGAIIALPGCNKETKAEPKSTASMGAMNDRCPLTGAAVNKSAPTANYHGKTVAFCCGGCAAKFDAMTDSEKDKKLAAMSTTTAK